MFIVFLLKKIDFFNIKAILGNWYLIVIVYIMQKSNEWMVSRVPAVILWKHSYNEEYLVI